MKDRIAPIVLDSSDSIYKAMESIEQGIDAGAPAGIVIVTEPGTEKIAGVVTDGDIRGALVSGKKIEDPIRDIMSTDPFRVQDSSGPTEMLNQVHRELDRRELSENKFHHIVVVDDEDQVLDVVTPFELWKRSEVRINTATVQGLGFVGLTLALTLAERGVVVQGVEKNPEKRQMLKNGKPHFHERGLESLLQNHIGQNFHVSDSIDDVGSDIFIMCVNTPTSDEGDFDSTYVEEAAREIGQNLTVHDLVVIRSTVVVGTSRDTILPIIEEESGLRGGEDFFFAYAPERTVAGNALKELKSLPQVIGGINQRSVDYASQVFQLFSKNTIPVSSLEAAEMVKLLNNCYRDVIFSFANETATLCEYWGLDAHEIIIAANRGYDRNQIPKPSPGVGGPCLTKDPYLLINSGKSVGYTPLLPNASRKINEGMTDVVIRKIDKFCQEKLEQSKPQISLMGIAFKGQPETSDIRNSPSVSIFEALTEKYEQVKVYDPVVPDEDIIKLGAEITNTPDTAFENANCVLVLTNHISFSNLDVTKVARTMADPGLLFDPWSLYNREEVDIVSHVYYDRFSNSIEKPNKSTRFSRE